MCMVQVEWCRRERGGGGERGREGGVRGEDNTSGGLEGWEAGRMVGSPLCWNVCWSLMFRSVGGIHIVHITPSCVGRKKEYCYIITSGIMNHPLHYPCHCNTKTFNQTGLSVREVHTVEVKTIYSPHIHVGAGPSDCTYTHDHVVPSLPAVMCTPQALTVHPHTKQRVPLYWQPPVKPHCHSSC